jgi:methyl-galactoside transport system substrate-binding protein
MNILKKLLSLIIISILLLHSIKTPVYAIPNITTQNPVKVGVFLNNLNDPFISNVKKNLEDLQKENENKIQFTFFDAKSNQVIQNENINQALDNDFDLFVINLVSAKISDIESTLNKILQKNIPLILHLAPSTEFANLIKPYGNVVIIGSDEEQSGTLQGKILVDTWNANKETIDKNKDNIMQYVMLKGPADSISAIFRTKYSINAINDTGIKTQQLLSVTCYWNQDCARVTMESAILNLNGKIEAIIANNDAMAIGAIEALQKYGFNKGDSSKYIPVVGVDALPEAQELIKQGVMTGTVVQDSRALADAIYTVGMNMVSGTSPLNGTNYKFDKTGITVKLPYYEYVK